ncbi:MAG: peptidoglycan-binding protein [Oscillospiraceae bacterium]
MQKGFLSVETGTSNRALPVIAYVTVYFPNGTVINETTDASGTGTVIEVDCPDKEISLNPGCGQKAYSVVDVRIIAVSFLTTWVRGVQVFAQETALLTVSLEPQLIGPDSEGENRMVCIEIPPNDVSEGGQFLDVPPEGNQQRILDVVAIPKTVTVHLGKPTASARNVTVSFSDYIKNVCCSEIYPTWPENAIRANIYCQISLVLNRIFTEWYRSKGYSFDITNSTGYDQYFVYGRNIFDNISKIVDDIFSTYIRKSNFVEPFYAEYCNGTTATCPGLKQWGTVTLANQGYSPLGILRYYYGNQVSLVQTNLVRGAVESYPGSALRLGSTGDEVRVIQNQLLRIRKNYPLIPSLTADGVFGNSTRDAVIQFQKIFNLTADGVVGRATWYKISYIFVAVKKLAELTSEGITTPDIIYPEPVLTLRLGDTGAYVSLAQFFLNAAAEYYAQLDPVAVDGAFGSNTRVAVMEFQTLRGIKADGVVGRATWNEMYKVFYAYMNSSTVKNPPYPGTALRVGSSGINVGTMQRYLNVISDFLTTINKLTIDSKFGNATKLSVQEYQKLFGLTTDGVIGANTWNSIVSVYGALVI